MSSIQDRELARPFKALGHERRIRLFKLLRESPETGRSFQSLQNETGIVDSSLFHHLREMERGGLIERRRKGSYMTFHLRPSGALAAMDLVFSKGEKRQTVA